MTTFDVSPAPATDREGGGFIRTYAAFIAAITLLVVIGAAGYALAQHPQYTSTTRVLVEPVVVPNEVARVPAMGTERAVVSSGDVLRGAAKLAGTSESALTSGLSVRVPVDTDTLSISESSTSPAVAQARARAVAQSYVAFRQTDSNPANGPPVPGLKTSIITDASLPGSPSSPDYVLTIIAGLMVGAMTGFLLALGIDRLGSRVRTRTSWQALAHAPVLMTLPKEALGTPPDEPLPGKLTEAFRYLRLKVIQAAPASCSVLVTSVTDQPAKPMAAYRLAEALACAGHKTLLFSVDPGNPWSDPIFGEGLHSGALMQSGSIAIRSWCSSATPNLQLSTIETATPPDLLSHSLLSASISQLHQLADFIVVDAPPVSHSTFVIDVARIADVAVLVDHRISNRQNLAYAAEELRAAGCWLVGGVLAESPTLRARQRWVRVDLGRQTPREGHSMRLAGALGRLPGDEPAGSGDEPS